jgi:hypothetical protein
MRNRCVEVAILVEGDAEIASTYLLSLVRSSSLPLLSEAGTPKDEPSLLTPLCQIYSALASSEVIDSCKSYEEGRSWDLKGSLLTQGLSISSFPRFRLFARLTRLVAIETAAGRPAAEALEYAIKAVLPFFSLAYTDNDEERGIVQRVRDMSVDGDCSNLDVMKKVRCPVHTVLGSSSSQHLSADLRASLLLLALLSSRSEVAKGSGTGIGWLRAAAKSCRDRTARDVSPFSTDASTSDSLTERAHRDLQEEGDRAVLDKDGAAIVTALEILSEIDTDTPDSMSGAGHGDAVAFIMSQLVRSASVQDVRMRALVHSVLVEAGLMDAAESFDYWVQIAVSSAQMKPLTATLCGRVIVSEDDSENGLSLGHSSVQQMLQRVRGSTSASMGAMVAAAVLGERGGSPLGKVRAALAYGNACSQLLDVSTFDRWATLDNEYRQRKEVDDASSLSSDSALPSLFALAYALQKSRIIADSKELQVLLSVHAALLVTDVVLARFTSELAMASPLNSTSGSEALTKGPTESGAVLFAHTIHSLTCLLGRRDMLSRILCSSACPPSGTGGIRMPWEEIIVSIRWIKKAVNALTNSVKRCLESGLSREGGNAGGALLEICKAAHVELSKFDRALSEYWSRPVLLDITVTELASSSAKLRLWKEGGHAAVPTQEDDWVTLQV